MCVTNLILIMICYLAVCITYISLAVAIINYQTFQCLSVIRPLHFLYRLQLITCTNLEQPRPSGVLHIWPHEVIVIMTALSVPISVCKPGSKWYNKIPKPLLDTVLRQLHLPLILNNYFPNISLKHHPILFSVFEVAIYKDISPPKFCLYF